MIKTETKAGLKNDLVNILENNDLQNGASFLQMHNLVKNFILKNDNIKENRHQAFLVVMSIFDDLHEENQSDESKFTALAEVADGFYEGWCKQWPLPGAKGYE